MPLPETTRLYFRPHEAADKDIYCAMEMDVNVRRYVGGQPRTREAAEQRFETMVHQSIEGLGMWATILKQDDIYIGRCGIYQHLNTGNQLVPNEAALGLYIAPAYWNKGLATEAARALIRYGFEELHLKRIVTMVEQGNDVSAHLMEKLGMIHLFTEPGQRSFLHYTLDNQSWTATR